MAVWSARERRSSSVVAAIGLLFAGTSCGGAGPQALEPQRPAAIADLNRAPAIASRLLTVAPRGGDVDAANPAGSLLAKETPPSEAPLDATAKEKSGRLPSGFHNPMPGGVFAGYRADTGLDIAGNPRPVYAIQSGTLDYSEPGHTLWTGPKDTANCVRFKLDAPIPWKGGRLITHVYYAHLSRLEYSQAEGASKRQRIEAGERLGVSGIANHSPHLHIGLLLDGEVEQYWGTFLLEDEIRQVLGGYRNGTRLPREEPAPAAAP